MFSREIISDVAERAEKSFDKPFAETLLLPADYYVIDKRSQRQISERIPIAKTRK